MKKSDARIHSEVKKHFDFFDDDKNGFIDFDEYLDLLKIMGINETARAAAQSFYHIDTDGDGRVSFDEFYTWWLKIWGTRR